MTYLPLIFAMRHLRIRITGEADACLMQGDRELPTPDDGRVREFCEGPEHAGGTLPEGVELRILQMQCPGLPGHVAYAMAGVVSFGARDLKRAAACARHAWAADPAGKMARQLVGLLLARQETRLNFGDPDSAAPDVVRILAAL